MFTSPEFSQDYRKDDFAGPAQAELVRRLFDRVDRDRSAAATIAAPTVTSEQMIDAVAWSFDLLPEEYQMLSQPLSVTMLRWSLQMCDDCGAVAEFEVQIDGLLSASLCHHCGLMGAGDRRLGPGSGQRYITLDDLPYEAGELCRDVAEEVHGRRDLF